MTERTEAVILEALEEARTATQKEKQSTYQLSILITTGWLTGKKIYEECIIDGRLQRKSQKNGGRDKRSSKR